MLSYLDLIRAENVEKIAWNFHHQWSGFFNHDNITLNDNISINDHTIDQRVYSSILKQARSKPILLIHNSSSGLDFMVLMYIF